MAVGGQANGMKYIFLFPLALTVLIVEFSFF